MAMGRSGAAPKPSGEQRRLDSFPTDPSARAPGATPRNQPEQTTALPRPLERSSLVAGSDWSADIERFLGVRLAENLVGTGWIRRMRWELRRFPALLRGSDGSAPPPDAAALRPEHVLAIRKGMRWEKATFAIHFAALRQFARWANNPIAANRGVWRLPSGQPSHRRWLTKPQLERLLAAARGPAKVLVALEGLNGLRRVEVLRLRKKDVLSEESSLRVLGKGRDGGKWRKIPMHPIVRELLVGFRRESGPEDRLFPISPSGADLLLQKAAGAARFGDEGLRVSHHDLRRTFGRLAHGSGMDLIQLKNLFGHASVEMTVHYIGLDADRMRSGLNRIELGRPARAPSDREGSPGGVAAPGPRARDPSRSRRGAPRGADADGRSVVR